LDYIGNGGNAIPFGFSIGQNELPVPISSPTQLSKPIGDKIRITNGCAGLGKDMDHIIREEAVIAIHPDNMNMVDGFCLSMS
jgi:hypothetical protein